MVCGLWSIFSAPYSVDEGPKDVEMWSGLHVFWALVYESLHLADIKV